MSNYKVTFFNEKDVNYYELFNILQELVRESHNRIIVKYNPIEVKFSVLCPDLDYVGSCILALGQANISQVFIDEEKE